MKWKAIRFKNCKVIIQPKHVSFRTLRYFWRAAAGPVRSVWSEIVMEGVQKKVHEATGGRGDEATLETSSESHRYGSRVSHQVEKWVAILRG